MSNGVTDFSRLELNLQNCLGNYRYFRSKLRRTTKLLVLVKANAYGHGAVEFALMMQNAGADYLAVALPVEGMELRQSGISLPILVLTAGTDYFDEIIDNRLEPGIPNIYTLKALVATLQPKTHHVMLETRETCRLPAGPRHRGLPDPHQTRHWNAPPRLHDQRVG